VMPSDHPLADTVALVIHQLLWGWTHGRAGFEPKHWLLDGFALYWARFGARPAAPLLGEADRWALRALVAAEMVPLSAEALRAYHLTAERVGDLSINALSATGWQLLEARIGRERTLALARAALARRGTGDVRDFVHERRSPMPELFQRETGLGWDGFLADWTRALNGLRSQPEAAAALAALPRGLIRLDGGAGGELRVSGHLAPALPAGTVCHVLHQRLPPYDAAVNRRSLEEIEVVWEARQTRLDQPVGKEYGPGERAFVALECAIEALAAPARLGVWRVALP
jgi:hypothetical protein